MAQVMLLGPNEGQPADADYLLLTEARHDSGELLVEVSGLVVVSDQGAAAFLGSDAKFPSLELALEEAQAYAAANGIPVIYVRRDA